MPRAPQYYPGVFEVENLQSAMAIILTNEGPGQDTATRWAEETPFTTDLVARHLKPGPGMLLLDYGCGIGRVARPLIEQFGCRVIGVDVSVSMRALAPTYFGDERFSVMSPTQFDALIARGLRIDAAIAIWVLQHCLDPAQDAARIKRALEPGGKLFVINMNSRAVPALEAAESGPLFRWIADGREVPRILRDNFVVEAEFTSNSDPVPGGADTNWSWMCLVNESSER